MPNTMVQKEPSKGLVLAAFISLYIIWGSTYLGNLLAIESVPPFIMAGSRFTIAGVLLYAWCSLQGQQTPPRKSVLRSALGGTLMLFCGTGAVIWVEQYLPSGLTAIIVATVPLWFVVLDKREWKTNFSNKKIIIGLLIGFVGVLMLFGGKSTAAAKDNGMRTVSFFILGGGSICWAIGSLYSKYKPTEGSTTIKAAIQMIAAGLASFLLAFILGEHHGFELQKLTLTSVGAMAYLITFGSLVGYLSYIWLLSVRPASLVGTYAYVNPVVAVFLGWLIAKEQITSKQVIALCIILVGVIMVNFSKDKKAPAVDAVQVCDPETSSG